MIVDKLFKIMFAKFQSDLSKIVEDMLKKKTISIRKAVKIEKSMFKPSFSY